MMYRTLLGIDSTPGWYSADEVVKQADRYDIPSAYSLTMDTVRYYQGLRSVYQPIFDQLKSTSADSSAYLQMQEVLKDDAQPVQFRLFDRTGTEVFKLVNCYIDRPLAMDWNVENCFDAFPPRINVESLNTHNFALDFLLDKATTADGQRLTRADLPVSDYYGVVVWNNFFVKPSRALVKTIQQQMGSNEAVHLIYINNQNAEIWQAMTPAQKRQLLEKL